MTNPRRAPVKATELKAKLVDVLRSFRARISSLGEQLGPLAELLEGAFTRLTNALSTAWLAVKRSLGGRLLRGLLRRARRRSVGDIYDFTKRRLREADCAYFHDGYCTLLGISVVPDSEPCKLFKRRE